MEEYRVVGQRLTKLDGEDRVTGKSMYGADVRIRGPILSGKVLRSPHAHARILKIDTRKAEALSGVVAVVTDADTPNIRTGIAVKDETVFARGKVRYQGEPVAAVAALDDATAEEALDLIEVDYELLPPVVDAKAAMAENSPLVHEEYATYIDATKNRDRKGNTISKTQIEQGDVSKGFAEADLIFEETFTTPYIHQAYLEPNAALAEVTRSGKVNVWVSGRGIFPMRSGIAEAFDMPMTQVRVIPTEIGGSFGGKLRKILEQIAVALAKKARKPVKLVMTRDEELLASNPRQGSQMTYKTGVKRDGTITAMEVNLIFDTGAYAFAGPGIAANGAGRATGIYRVPHLRVE
ncbi:MAG: xanthine dehydrogenase family protein molybdopterin-binding subunit, partial [Candidatus Tectomicrobia bacterium]|nr:xanthine dehydrogenase family protein molybdopterin-binding subunit [Candidatus Tectomicrobia bacterium]